jgi:hypothetical protein
MSENGIRGVDLFKIAGESISGWIPSWKLGGPKPSRQPLLMDNINDRRRRIILAAQLMKRSDDCSVWENANVSCGGWGYAFAF